MTDGIELAPILLAAFVAAASPGPAVLAIAGASMARGRIAGLGTASGVAAGSLFWSGAAALGLSAIIAANGWVLEIVRWAGAGYLLYLSVKSARSALRGREIALAVAPTRRGSAFARGLAIHLTNPKAILFFAALYSIGVGPGASGSDLVEVFLLVGIQSAIIFHAYALAFAAPGVRAFYARTGRWFDGLCAAFFGFVAFKIATARLQ